MSYGKVQLVAQKASGMVVPETRGGHRANLFHIETCPDVNENPVWVGKLAFDIEGVGEWDEDGLGFYWVFVSWAVCP